MVDTSQIQQVISKARRRLRLQAALEAAITASIPAFAAALVTVFAVRSHWVTESTGIALLLGCVGVIAIGAVIGAMRRFPTSIVATRIDRASGLADRLATACAFEQELRGRPGEAHHPETLALMQAAVRDAVQAAPRADVVAATPFRKPRDTRAAAAFGVVAALIAGIYWTDESRAAPATNVAVPIMGDKDLLPKNPVVLDQEDLDYTRELLEDLRRTAIEEQEPTLDEFVKSVEDLLSKAERGELTKEQLLEELKKAEQKFMDGADSEEMEKAMDDLKDTGKELQKNDMTKELGKALEKGDLDKAQEEFEKLAEKLESNQLSEKQQQELAKALEKAAQKFNQKEQQRDKQMDKQIDQAQKDVQKLQRKLDQEKDQDEKSKLQRRLEKKKRELKQLQRQKEQQDKSAQKRSLKRLHRNMEKAAENLEKQQDKNQSQEQQQENRRMASRDLKSASKDTGKVDADRRKMAAQKKVATQLSDLKEALRRARRRGQQGPKDMFGKNNRNQDFNRRARGQQGSKGAWRPGQTRLGQGQGQGQKPGQQPGQQPGGNGQKPGGDQYGTGHDPNLMGDPTGKTGNTKDEQVSGVHGRGPSRRETILSSAQKGFASRSYQDVYQRYKTIVEEVIRAEKVPAGYKYYVKKYFQKIKPHAM